MRFTPTVPALLAASSLVTAALAASVCNGHAELCSRLYSNVTFIGAHDSYAVGSSVADNQDKTVTSQLTDGVRTLQVQMHNASDGIHLCHTSCDLVDGGLLSTYLANVSSWIGSNPNDVVTLVLVNSDDLAPTAFTSAFQSAGLTNKVYTPPTGELALSLWPSLGTLIDAGTTLVVFMDYQADFAAVPYIIDEFSNMFEDAYDVTSSTWECAVNRTSGNPSAQMMMVNHFLDLSYNLAGTQLLVPDKAMINTTNAASGPGSIGQHTSNCASIWGRYPNHILLDFYDSDASQPFDLVAQLNGVSAPTNTVTPGSAAIASSGASGSTGSGASSSQTAVVSQSKLSAAGQRIDVSRSWQSGGGAIAALGIVAGAMVLAV